MRYIDADALIKKIYPMGIGDGKYTINAKAVKLAIDNTPTADVVPKSEYDAVVSAVDNSTKGFLKLHDDYQEAKREVDKWMSRCREWHEVAEEKSKLVREIFEEIDKVLVDVCGEYRDHMNINGVLYTNGARSIIAELKKKYIPQSTDRCVVCGEIGPEGRQVCLKRQIEKGD